MSDKVEILLATYQGEKYIRQQLDSILAQDYQNWVVRACDDASTDGTFEILKEYKNQYPEKFLIEQKEKGSGSAKANFFYLIKQSTSDYVMCCDQDDVWLPNKIGITLKKMKQTESTGVPALVHTDLKVADHDLNVISQSFFEHSNLDPKANFRNVLIQNNVTGCTMMMNRSLVDLMNMEEDHERILMHDWLAALLASALGRVAFVEMPTIFYRQHEVNSVGAKKYGLKLFAEKLFGQNIRKSLEDTALQANRFACTYQAQLNEDDYRLVKEYGQIYTKKKWSRICFYFRNKIWKKGLPRKVCQLLLG